MSCNKWIIFFGLLFSSLPINADTAPLLTLQTATELALQDNPGLAAIRMRSEALAAIPDQQGALPDPVFSFNALNLPVDSFNTTQENMTQLQIGVMQSIPFPGKLGLRERVALHQAEASADNIDEARFQLVRDVKNSWWRVYYLDKALQLLQANQDLLRQFIQITRTKYEVGEGLQQDVLLAQLELSKLLAQRLSLTGKRAIVLAELNTLINQAANKPWQLPESVNLGLPGLLPENKLYQIADTGRALLNGLQQGIKAAEAELDYAKKSVYPDMNVGVYYGFRDHNELGVDRADLLSVKLSVNVPLFAGWKQHRQVDQRSSELMQQQYQFKDKSNQVHGQIAQAYQAYQQARAQFNLYQSGIIPQARQTVASMLAGYQVNKVDFLNLNRSQVTLFNYEVQYWLVFVEAQQALAQLTAAVGKGDIYE